VVPGHRAGYDAPVSEVDKEWRPGDIVVLRYVETPESARQVHAIMGNPAGTGYPFLAGGRVITVQARPYRVVSDTNGAIVLFQPEGTPLPRWQIDEERYLPDIPPSRGESLRFLYPGLPYDITIFFDGKGDPPWYFDALFGGEGLTAGWRERRRRTGIPVGAAGTRDVSRPRFRGWYVNMDLPFRRTPYGFDITDQTLDIIIRPDRSWYWKDEDEITVALEKGAMSQTTADHLRNAGLEVIAMLELHRSPFDDEWTDYRTPWPEPIEDIPDGWQYLPGMIED
jgi:hypothetical protein